MISILVQLDGATYKALNQMAPAAKRKRTEFIRTPPSKKLFENASTPRCARPTASSLIRVQSPTPGRTARSSSLEAVRDLVGAPIGGACRWSGGLVSGGMPSILVQVERRGPGTAVQRKLP